jgi:fatty-acyl-CoA synthase
VNGWNSVAAPPPKWQERPLAAVVLKEGCQVTADELRSFLACKFAEWQAPDEFIFVPSLPHTSTGKLLKSELRKRFQD